MPSKKPRTRPATPQDDLTPPEELQARRRRRLLLLALAVLAVLAVAIYFGASPVSGAIKSWQSRRLAHQAFVLIEQKQWNEADAKARDAFLLRPTEPEAWRAIARLHSRIGKNATALEWWKKIDEQHRLTVEDRRDFAKAALVAGELTTAATQIDQLLAQRGGPQPVDILLAGQLAARRNDALLAVDYAQRTLADKRTKPYDILSAATLVLSVTTTASPPYISAWKRIEDLARDPQNAASLDALTFLATQQSLAPTRESGGDTSLTLGPSGVAPQPAGRMGLIEIADALEKHPEARPHHKLLALQLRVQHDPVLVDQYVADAVERFGGGDNDTLAALAAWLNSFGRTRKTLELLPLNRAVQSQDLFLRYIDALAALERWDEVKEILMSERFPLEPVFQHMYLATARTRLGEATAATNEWQRALGAASTPEKLLALASYAEQNRANDLADTAYSEAIKLGPKNRAAHAGRLRVALASGHTAEAQTVAAEIVQLWPEDAAARNEDAYLRLLLGASDGAAEAAERQAQVLVAQEPSNWAARATLGLARLRLGKKQDALKAFRSVWATGSEPPGALAVRALILAENGYEDGARNDAHNLGAEHLLPEERALIAPLLYD